MRNVEGSFWPKLLCGFLILGIILSVCLAAQEQSAAPDISPVTVYVTAAHKNGSPAALTASDVVASVNKAPSSITNVSPARDEPLLFALLVDVSHSDVDNAKAIRRSALQIFQALSSNNNQGYLVLFDQDVAISQTPLSPARAETNLNGVNFGGATALYDAIVQTCEQVFGNEKNRRNTRRVIVLISDGGDNQSRNNASEATAAAQKEDVAIFSLLVPLGHSGFATPRLEHVREISRDTGGITVDANLVHSVPVLLSAVEEQWKLTIVPGERLAPKMYGLHVKSKAKDIEITAPSQIAITH